MCRKWEILEYFSHKWDLSLLSYPSGSWGTLLKGRQKEPKSQKGWRTTRNQSLLDRTWLKHTWTHRDRGIMHRICTSMGTSNDKRRKHKPHSYSRSYLQLIAACQSLTFFFPKESHIAYKQSLIQTPHPAVDVPHKINSKAFFKAPCFRKLCRSFSEVEFC